MRTASEPAPESSCSEAAALRGRSAMAGAWVERRRTASGVIYRVKFRVGGRESPKRYAGAFGTKREADTRKAWVLGELAAMRVPDLGGLVERQAPVTLRALAEAWQAARVDVAEGTAQTYRVALGRLLPRLGDMPAASLAPSHVADLVAELTEAGLRKQTIRKTVSVMAMILDHHGVQPNPARDKRVKLPREERRELTPPTAEHVLAVFDLLPSAYRLPLLVLDATGMRVGELEALTWGDVDERRGRWRVTATVAKMGVARWVDVPAVLFEAVSALVPRDDRTAERRVFQGFGSDRFRTALTRACTATGVPTFSPHDLRHRRVSLLHAQGLSWARIGERVGHADLVTTARTYTHVLGDEAELAYAKLLA
jgi:integrase